TWIGDDAFRDCSGLTSLNLPAGITSIGSYAFYHCSGLTSLNLPAGITKIGFGTFEGCSGLTSLNLPAGITRIGDDAFRDCSGLTSLNLPDGITSIGDRAFKGCSGLTSLNLPDGITEIGWYAFQGCSGLTSIYVYAEKVPKIGGNVFEGIDAEKCTLYVPMGTYDDYRLSYIGSFFKYILEFDATGIDKITINLKKAGTLPDRIAINKKYEITNLKIIGEINGTDLRMIREMARSKLSVLDLSEAKIVEGGGCYYNNYYTSNDVIGPSTFEDCSGLTSLTLPAGITEIGDFAFWGCSGLTSLTLPAGITSIGYDAFYGCSGLTSLTLPDGITEIGIYAFKGCSGLTSLTLPDGITWIGHDAFKGCSGLTSIYVYAEKVPGYSNVFEGVDAKKCTLYVPMGTRDDYLHSLFGTYFENIVEFDATGIDKTTISTDVEEVARYSVNGQRLSAPTKGLNIVKYSDGSVKKVAIR
ncbi:leucine-rich repeat domain-containing protein, partial [Prevotella copri]|uniref:leucine-rich repeat domain-containing protein n=1 Tax=Segatella copri TaxID=165179 RepID=UPI001F22A024